MCHNPAFPNGAPATGVAIIRNNDLEAEIILAPNESGPRVYSRRDVAGGALADRERWKNFPILPQPVNLVAAPAGGAVTLTWNSGNPNPNDVFTYAIERSVDLTNWVQLNFLTPPNQFCNPGCTRTDPNPVANMRNFYRVIPRYSVGADPVTTIPGQNYDGPVSAFAAACVGICAPLIPAAVSIQSITSSTIQIAWQDTADETLYKIEGKVAGGNWSPVGTASQNVTTFTASNLSFSTTYFFRVRAYNSSGDSPYSDEVSATTNAAPVPGAFSLSSLFIAQGQPYAITVVNGGNMTLNVEYDFNNVPQPNLERWPQLQNGVHVVDYTAGATPGTYKFKRIQNADGGPNAPWVSINNGAGAYLYVSAVPTWLGIAPDVVTTNPNSLFYGQCYSITVGNLSDTTVAVRVTMPDNSVWESTDWPILDVYGQSIPNAACASAGTPLGWYHFTDVMNLENGVWKHLDTPGSVYVTSQ
jgi:hypothetical protein